jgi:uncharacterized membrane protein YdjX (TVP38/TMEM64 family)
LNNHTSIADHIIAVKGDERMGRGVDTSAGLHPTHHRHLRTKRRLPLYLLPVIALGCAGLLAFVVYVFQSSLPPSKHKLLPSSLEELSKSSGYIALVAKQRPWGLAITFSLAYLMKQTFSVPGSVALNIFAGLAFGHLRGVILTCFLTAIGASLAYLLSFEFGHHLIHRFPKLETKILPLKLRIGAARKRKTLIFYLAALRMTSFFPQWLLNLASPHLSVPLVAFFFPATLFGTLPYNAVTVGAGAALADALHSEDGKDRPPLVWSDIISTKTMLLMMAMAAVVALPGLLMKRLEARMGLTSAEQQVAEAAGGASSSAVRGSPTPSNGGDLERNGGKMTPTADTHSQ